MVIPSMFYNWFVPQYVLQLVCPDSSSMFSRFQWFVPQYIMQLDCPQVSFAISLSICFAIGLSLSMFCNCFTPKDVLQLVCPPVCFTIGLSPSMFRRFQWFVPQYILQLDCPQVSFAISLSIYFAIDLSLSMFCNCFTPQYV